MQTSAAFPDETLTRSGEVIRPVTAALTSVTSGYVVFPPAGRLARLGWTLGGSLGHLRGANLLSVVRSCCVSMPGGSVEVPVIGRVSGPS